KSENAFFVFEKYNANFHQNYENVLLQSNNSDAVLGGWVNVDGENYEAFVYLVSKNGIIEHTNKNLIKLYKD
ncbi:MAG: 3-oxoacyl-ACP synthase, partial [Flavobacteriaceae bacterium]|nr:3-oxoacyl-ACP synthase [Flavobacteriaceae bacterium]